MLINVPKLKGKITEKGYSQANLASLVGIDRSTFYRKMKNGGKKFSIEEVNHIIKTLSLSRDEAIAIFFNY